MLCRNANAAETTHAELLERIEKLEDQSVYVKDLEQEVQLLKRQIEVKEEAEAGKGPSPVIGAGPDGFFLQSADKNFVIKLRGYTQLDTRSFFGEGDENNVDTFLFRRVRPIVEGTRRRLGRLPRSCRTSRTASSCCRTPTRICARSARSRSSRSASTRRRSASSDCSRRPR